VKSVIILLEKGNGLKNNILMKDSRSKKIKKISIVLNETFLKLIPYMIRPKSKERSATRNTCVTCGRTEKKELIVTNIAFSARYIIIHLRYIR
jgi:hypothetical protein